MKNKKEIKLEDYYIGNRKDTCLYFLGVILSTATLFLFFIFLYDILFNRQEYLYLKNLKKYIKDGGLSKSERIEISSIAISFALANNKKLHYWRKKRSISLHSSKS